MSGLRAVWAEGLKVRRSAASRLPWAGLGLALLQGSLFLLSAQALHTWPGLTAWQSLWVTFLLPLFLALLSGLSAMRELRAQGGGLWWRPVSWNIQGRAELLWLAGLSLALNAAVVLPTLPFGVAARVPGAWPWGRLALLTLVLTLASLPLLALGQRLARRFGLIAGLVVAFVGNLSDLRLAERPLWFLTPWAWPIRASLTLTGTGANGVPLPPDSPLWQVSPWPVVLVSVLVTAALAAWPYALPRLVGSARFRAAAPLRPWRWHGALAAELVKFRHTALPWLVVLAPVLLALLALWRLSAENVWEVWSLLAVPFAAALLPAVAWGWEGEAWRVLRTRASSPTRLYGVKLLALWLAALLAGGLLFGLLALVGKPLASPALLAGLYALACFALLAVHLWLAARFSPGVTLGVGVVTTLLAAILGGTGLGAGVWPAVPWVWLAVLPRVPAVQMWPYALALAGLGGVALCLGSRAAQGGREG